MSALARTLCHPMDVPAATLAAALARVDDALGYPDAVMKKLRKDFRTVPLFRALLGWKDVARAFEEFKGDIDSYIKLEEMIEDALGEVVDAEHAALMHTEFETAVDTMARAEMARGRGKVVESLLCADALDAASILMVVERMCEGDDVALKRIASLRKDTENMRRD
jgi:hypothetical protein